MQPYHKTIAELHHDLINKKYSSVELTSLYLKRIKNLNPKINSFITVSENIALENAKLADQIIQQGNASSLTGIPIAYKDNCYTKNIKTTCASKMLANFIPTYDATTVTKLKQAGTVMLGKTNLDEFAMGSSNESSYFGPVLNPWCLDRVSGGSSGGGAAAIAARLVPAGIGSDTGGSIRQPAAFCGITALRPTYNLVSHYGIFELAPSLDQVGPMGRTAQDIALILQAVAENIPNQSITQYSETLNTPLKNLTLGIPKEFFSVNLNTGIALAIDEAIKNLEDLGIKIQEISLPNSKNAISTYHSIVATECLHSLAKFDGKYCDEEHIKANSIAKIRDLCFGTEVKRRLLVAGFIEFTKKNHDYYLAAQKTKDLVIADFADVFSKVDVILSPMTTGPAFKLNEKIESPVDMYFSDMYAVSVSLAGLPALAIPIGFSEYLPVGMQLIGNYFTENKLLNIAHQYQKITNWHNEIPEGFD